MKMGKYIIEIEINEGTLEDWKEGEDTDEVVDIEHSIFEQITNQMNKRDVDQK